MEIQTYKVSVVSGVVIRNAKKYALVQEAQPKAYGLWNLPAGHVDVGESFEEAAIREAKEECGLDVELKQKIGIFQVKPDAVVKHFYFAETDNSKLVFPREEILHAKWFSFNEIQAMKNKLRDPEVYDAIKIAEETIK